MNSILQAAADLLKSRKFKPAFTDDGKPVLDDAIMRKEGLLDLDNHKGKAPGAYCTAFPVLKRPLRISENTWASMGLRFLVRSWIWLSRYSLARLFS